ncbi:4-hydroxy-tetrahydrodipicolinate synthase [Bacilliculturomica massiliensis]|uniref:4-hydroxy-tetrahydrodipicolinate synthase n=1 Tax=Bacilliculturomica massiliensis TaxID=1917867 RepID=UPI001FE913D3|nr:4-hydroxy-tetrahydrodipicolinate synthase [Bacilliculturomica massiliensis]
MMTATQLRGSIVALVTPFNDDNTTNFGKLAELLDWHIENGTDGILVLGTTGETSTMSHEQDDEICRFAIERVNGRIPVIAGIGSNSTQTQLEKGLKYSAMGADALLAIAPYYIKSNVEGMYHHFADVADQTDAPLILYNVPGRTGCSIPVEVVERLSAHPNIIGIKEASGDIAYVTKIARFLSDDFAMCSGNDDITIPLMSLGASGVISVWANVMPAECHNMVFDYLEGRREQAAAAQLAHLDLINGLFMEVNPIPVKEAMNLMGFGVGGYNLPLYPMAAANREKLIAIMEREGLLNSRRCAGGRAASFHSSSCAAASAGSAAGVSAASTGGEQICASF